MANGTVILSLPYPVRFGFISFTFKRKIGFTFDQRALLLMLNNNNIDLPDHQKWFKKVGQSAVLFETIFAGAQSYSEQHRTKDNFTRKGLQLALSIAGKSASEKIIKCWQDSEALGRRDMPNTKDKKKVMT